MHHSDEQPIEGMTVNERLCHFGLMEEFNAAMRVRDAELGMSILQQAKFTPEQAAFTVSTTLSDPERYGF